MTTPSSVSSSSWVVGSMRSIVGLGTRCGGLRTIAAGCPAATFIWRSPGVARAVRRAPHHGRMRSAYYDQLDLVVDELVAMTQLVQESVVRATQALLTADARVAEQVVSADAALDQAR